MRVIFLAPFALFPVAAFGEPAGALLPQPPLAEHIAAFPRVAGGGEASQAINARLQLLDDGAAEMSDCDFTREVEVALDSPGYLSLYGREGGYCQGAAHPFFAEYGLTFDRNTGAEVDWAKLLPEALLATTDEGYDPTYPFASAALNAAYLAKADPALVTLDCKETYDMGLSFDFWLQAGKGLAMLPSNLPYAATACANTVYVSVDDLRAAGADAGVIAALDGTGAASE